MCWFAFAGQQVTAVVDGELPVKFGAPLSVAVNADQVYVFDRLSGLAL
jgi:multiple sugar transport system ATP-binding protein